MEKDNKMEIEKKEEKENIIIKIEMIKRNKNKKDKKKMMNGLQSLMIKLKNHQKEINKEVIKIKIENTGNQKKIIKNLMKINNKKENNYNLNKKLKRIKSKKLQKK
jgi:hypothetical protein